MLTVKVDVLDITEVGNNVVANAIYRDLSGNYADVQQHILFAPGDPGLTDPTVYFAKAVTLIQAYAALANYTLAVGDITMAVPSLARVSGVSKMNLFPIMASPAVAGGSGVARFYIDSNGDGTGTAPSAVYTASLQAVVVNTTASYLPQSITVDTNRKYIDVKMGQLATGLAGIIPILTGAVANAANGTVVNCLVFVQA